MKRVYGGEEIQKRALALLQDKNMTVLQVSNELNITIRDAATAIRKLEERKRIEEVKFIFLDKNKSIADYGEPEARILMKRKAGRPGFPSVIINQTHSECIQFRLSTAVGLHGQMVSVQIDTKNNTIKITKSEDGRFVNKKLGYFGFTSAETRLLPKKIHIPLKQLEEGCWIGLY
ncbi:hypothetical protein QK313_00085 [Klebsiella michiganensis]|uniref:hypothetical protein n=1 Tax=Klebsiella michiganensis TaxID=1134687 RepID=UPI00249BFD34|nr:hypothetical protein [Klebsiella michiganensis]MDI3166339.1 hypothetical protein [Klebsiella michiganensis]